jgi:hypothetical protein
METECIQFAVPVYKEDAENDSAFKRSIKKLVIGVLTRIIPAQNPDFDNTIGNVAKWLVECDKETGTPQREIGLDNEGRVLMKMPFKKNYGYWTDNNMLLDDFRKHFEVSEITKEEFERQWALFETV